MATSPYGGFADLSSARRLVDARMANDAGVLNALIGGLQQGAALQRLPETMQQEALSKQLALAVQQAQLDKLQRPQVFQIPNGILVEDQTVDGGFRTVIGPTKAAPAPKLGRIIVDEATGRIYEVTPTGMRERTLTEGSLPGAAETQNQIFSDEPLVPAAGTPGGVLTPKLPREVGLKTKNFVADDGSTHTYSVDAQGNRIADLGIAKAAPVLTPKGKGADKAPPADLQKQYIGSQNLFQTAPRLEAKIAELRKAGVKEPTDFEKTIINLAYQDPKGLMSGFATAVATGQIRPEIADLEQLRAEIESNYVTAKAGLSQTASEVKRTIPVAPTRFDSWDRMLSKTRNLREVAGINVANINKQYPNFGKSQASAPQAIEFSTEEEIPDSLPVGTPVSVGGRPGIWEGR